MTQKLKLTLLLLTISTFLLVGCGMGEFIEEEFSEEETEFLEEDFENEEAYLDEEDDEEFEDEEWDEPRSFESVANEDIRILAIGDSIFDSVPGGQDIPEVLGRELNINVLNNAHGGAQLVLEQDEQNEWGAMMDIRNQYITGDWDWIVMDGGGNDLNDDCSCGECDAVLNEIITADGQSGALPEAVQQMATGDTKIMFMMYYNLPEGAEFGFNRCEEWHQTYEDRLRRMGEGNQSVFIVDASDVVKATDLQYFQEDLVHPSQEGAEVLGAYLAEKIREQQ